MPCCDFETFCCGLRKGFDKKKIGWALIDWKAAKTQWQKYHCTGGESALMLIRSLNIDRQPIVVANLIRKITYRLNDYD